MTFSIQDPREQYKIPEKMTNISVTNLAKYDFEKRLVGRVSWWIGSVKAPGKTGLKSSMKETYRENLASHSGHEPYAGSSNVPGVAWASGDAG
jgi:hypothetical protein